ncbi:actin-binding Rho-activating protein-like isoform X2 [Zootermopsis nevadensis]|uniref:actin-binding Rho-activating protein-like isoform X2 n=1 Tax=Zootermopsis nevadensis TaxID=136037 RepID=UPI000B8E262A|nr:actin-binding Rho-activating protein-like isoform X2 [Zootermopsis nevadensis]
MDKEEIERLLNTPSDMRSCKHVGLSDKVALFNKKADQHVDTQTKNPFSAAEGVTIDKPKLDKNDPNYGRPVAGSKTDIRGKRAYTHISKEVLQLCQIIYENGVPIEEITEDGHNQIVITFGELFQNNSTLQGTQNTIKLLRKDSRQLRKLTLRIHIINGYLINN